MDIVVVNILDLRVSLCHPACFVCSYFASVTIDLACVDPLRLEDALTSTRDEFKDPVLLHLDRPLDDELVQMFVKNGFAMSGHVAGVGDIRAGDAAGKMLQVGMGLLLGENTSRQPGSTGGPVSSSVRQSPDAGPGHQELASPWGLERVYAIRLGSLGETSTI